jgi:hypothetical protein
MLELIYDRTSADVTSSKSLILRVKKYGIGSLSSEDKTKYLQGLRGCYNISDLNRVESAVEYLSGVLNGYGYINVVNTKSWVAGEIFTDDHVTRYLSNISILRQAYFNMIGTPDTPNSYKPYSKANDIEKILHNIESIFETMKTCFIHSGVAKSGQNRLAQNYFRR